MSDSWRDYYERLGDYLLFPPWLELYRDVAIEAGGRPMNGVYGAPMTAAYGGAYAGATPSYGGGYAPGYEGISQFMGGQVAQAPAPARRQLYTMVVSRDPMTGSTTLIDGYKGRPYLSRKDFASFNKVLRLQKRLNRLVPRRSRRRKKGR